jgi:hypothetical protein
MEPVSLQVTHAPVHAMLQHTPSTQKPDKHPSLFSQSAPLMLLPQEPATHWCSEEHCESVVHLLAQRLVLGSQVYGGQGCDLASEQLPSPSQVRMSSTESAWQVPSLHTVPRGYFRQPPLPSQVPSRPQAPAVLAGHMDESSGRAPAGTAAHSPRELGRLHAMQVSPHEEAQHTPSTQKPVWHWRSQPQGSPLFLDRLGVSSVQTSGAVTSVGASTRPSLAASRPIAASTGTTLSKRAFWQADAHANTNTKAQTGGVRA